VPRRRTETRADEFAHPRFEHPQDASDLSGGECLADLSSPHSRPILARSRSARGGGLPTLVGAPQDRLARSMA
jgi:hypothetical protein